MHVRVCFTDKKFRVCVYKCCESSNYFPYTYYTLKCRLCRENFVRCLRARALCLLCVELIHRLPACVERTVYTCVEWIVIVRCLRARLSTFLIYRSCTVFWRFSWWKLNTTLICVIPIYICSCFYLSFILFNDDRSDRCMWACLWHFVYVSACCVSVRACVRACACVLVCVWVC